jgi:8-oxo-dGTP pyrophosphatase MutT (NUDIX family)
VDAISAILRASPKPFVGDKAEISRVRCVLMHRQRYLLAQHNTRRSAHVRKWALPGGRLKGDEKPKACLRRELLEELDYRVSYLVKLGDWLHDNEQHRVFGCAIDERIATFNANELRAIGWFTFQEVIALAAAGKLRTGFELAAIAEFRRRHAPR